MQLRKEEKKENFSQNVKYGIFFYPFVLELNIYMKKTWYIEILKL